MCVFVMIDKEQDQGRGSDSRAPSLFPVPRFPGLTFVAYGHPIPQGSKRIVGAQRLGMARARLIDVNSMPLKAWRKTIGESAMIAMRQTGFTMLEAVPVELLATFTLQPPKDQLKRIARAPTEPAPVHKTPDLDKLLRSLFDALTDLAITDDRLIAHVEAGKRYAGSLGALDQPGVMVTVRRWQP